MNHMGFVVPALLLAACATTPATETANASDCFRSATVSGFSIVDDHNVRVSAGAGRGYILTTNWNVRELDWTEVIAIRSATGRICTGSGLGVELIGGDPRRTYPITTIARAPETPANQGA